MLVLHWLIVDNFSMNFVINIVAVRSYNLNRLPIVSIFTPFRHTLLRLIRIPINLRSIQRCR